MSYDYKKPGRKRNITISDIERRDRCIAALHLMDCTPAQIHDTVRVLGSVTGWGDVTQRQIQRSLKKSFRDKPMTAKEIKDYNDGLREGALDQLAMCLEHISLYVHALQKDTNGNHQEFMEAVKIQAGVLQTIIEARGLALPRGEYAKWGQSNPRALRKYKQKVQEEGGREELIDKIKREEGYIL
jgi:hypothetical protein